MPETNTRAEWHRQPPLDHDGAARVFPGSPAGDLLVYAEPSYVLFIERMWHGDYQQVPVEPDDLDELIDALSQARDYAAGRTEADRAG